MKAKGKPQIGAVIEIQTPRGLAYAQFSHYSPRMGELIRVLPGFHQSRPKSFADLVAAEEQFFVFYPLKAAVKQKLVSVVDEGNVPEAISAFPLMRMPGLPDREGRIEDWWLFDGQQERPLDSLTPELERLSIAELWGHPVLVQRIAEEWDPSQFGKQPVTKRPKTAPSSTTKRAVKYYLYAKKKALAEKVSRVLKREGYQHEVQRSGDGNRWLILVSCFLDSSELQATTAHLEQLASSLDVTFDGEEIAL